jgi:outer membrane assembly lipoprotein YfiO
MAAGFAALLLTISSAAAAPRSWDYAGGGQWQAVQTPTTAATQFAPDPGLSRIEALISHRQYKPAYKAAVRWLTRSDNRASPQRDRGLLLAAEALYGYGNRIRSFYYLDELLDTYPESPLYYPALEMQYRIAEGYLEGYKRRLLYVPFLGAYEEGIEMLYRIQNRSPGSPLAEKALLRTADYYYASAQYDFAADAYGWYVKQYPRSPMAPRARLRQAFANLAQFRGLRFDATPMIDAREQLRAIAAAYPDLAAEENIAAVLERIDATFAQKLYATADFYRRTNADRAAVYTYRYLLKAYPDKPEAQLAQARLEQMPQWALNEPGPGTVGGEGPATPEEVATPKVRPAAREAAVQPSPLSDRPPRTFQ